MLDRLSATHPSLVAEVVPKRVDLLQLTEVLQRLVREGVSIRDLKSVLEALAEWGRVQSDPIELAELVRGSLSRQICFPLAQEDGTLLVHTVDGEIQQAIRESIRRTEAGSYLGLPPDMQDEILAATRRSVTATDRAVNSRSSVVLPPVLLVDPDVRPHLRSLLEHEFPHVAVLSMRELPSELVLRSVGTITVTGDPIQLEH